MPRRALPERRAEAVCFSAAERLSRWQEDSGDREARQVLLRAADAVLGEERETHFLNGTRYAWGEYLEQLDKSYRWEWFGTFTFSEPKTTAEAAHYWFRKYLKAAEDIGLFEANGYLGDGKPYAFRADEYGGQNGRLHLHALVGNVRHLTAYCGERLPVGEWGLRCCWLHRWPCGYARILPYDPNKGARFYLTKYVTKKLGDYELLGFDA